MKSGEQAPPKPSEYQLFLKNVWVPSHEPHVRLERWGRSKVIVKQKNKNWSQHGASGHVLAGVRGSCTWLASGKLMCVLQRGRERFLGFLWKYEAYHHGNHLNNVTKCATKYEKQFTRGLYFWILCKSYSFWYSSLISTLNHLRIHLLVCFTFFLSFFSPLSITFYRSSVGSALPRRRCCAYITIGMICIFIGVGLTVSTAYMCVCIFSDAWCLSGIRFTIIIVIV